MSLAAQRRRRCAEAWTDMPAAAMDYV